MESDDCIFKEVLTKSFYDNYLSYKHSGKDLMLGFLRTGLVVAVAGSAANKPDSREYETEFVTKLSPG